MKICLLLLPAILFCFFGCSKTGVKSNSSSNSKSANTAASQPTSEINDHAGETNRPKTQTNDNAACFAINRKDLAIDKKQTFAIDFKPFEKSCFVTFHDPAFNDPPLRSQFFIYQNGKEVFNFPEQFGGANASCWVNAVAFEDINNDQLKDIIIAGRCGSKADAYNENMVYLNTGRDFVTNSESNAETMDFSKTDQIKDFVKKNPKMFSR